MRKGFNNPDFVCWACNCSGVKVPEGVAVCELHSDLQSVNR